MSGRRRGRDAAAATATLSDAMLPASVTVNSTANYTFAGTGYLSGTMGLTKAGSGTLTTVCPPVPRSRMTSSAV